MGEFFNAHLHTKFDALSPKQKWLWACKTFHPDMYRTEDAYTDIPNTIREENFSSDKSEEAWREYITNPARVKYITFPGLLPREKRTFEIPQTLDEYRELRKNYSHKYLVAHNAVRPIDLINALKDDDVWDRHFSDAHQRTKVTFPGSGEVAERTFNIPKTRNECFTLFAKYDEFQKGFGPAVDPNEYPPTVPESYGDEDAGDDTIEPEEELSYALTPLLESIKKVPSIQALKNLIEPIYRESFPEQLQHVPVAKDNRDTVNFVQEVNKRALQLLTEQRGDIDSLDALAQFAQDVFDFPLQTIESERQFKDGKNIGNKLVLKRDQYPDGYEDQARELVLQACAEWIRSPRKTKTLKAAQSVIDNLPESKYYAQTRAQLSSILAERKGSIKPKKGSRGTPGSPEDLTN